ncbi:MAG: hypothetical protein DRO01_00030 [Thermoproteota archaeon]|nr:MAG: hypothetical protein DRO01_00030 [Candidatus Korarchaeota archaeon]
MFFNTLKFIIVTIIFTFIIGGVVYLFLAPFNQMVFFQTGIFQQKFKQMAEERITLLNNSSSIKTPLLNASVEENEFENKIIEARKNDQTFWVLFSIIAFIFSILFYTGWTQIKRGGS